MMCPTCLGTGIVMRVLEPGFPGIVSYEPCPNPECHGGQMHCCDGPERARDAAAEGKRHVDTLLVVEADQLKGAI